VATPVGESRSDIEIIFDLAQRLDLTEQFFGGDLEAAFAHQLAPAQLSPQQLRQSPVGLRANVTTRHRKYGELDERTGEPNGFATPTRKIEIYSTTFANAGYSPLPVFERRNHDGRNEQYPLTLTFYRLVQFCDEQHRNIPRLRRSVPEPFLEIHPQTASAQSIENGEWVSLETASGKVQLKTKFNDSLHPDVVATVYGWWQACRELDLNGQDPFTHKGANANLLVPNCDVDPISASVAHRAQKCRIRKENIS
jgi:anaerobic selenocysteine-containing dehydrogenase